MLNEFAISKFCYLNISLRMYFLWYQIVFCTKVGNIVHRLGRGDLKFSFTKHTQFLCERCMTQIRVDYDIVGIAMEKWKVLDRGRNVAPVEVRQDALRKSKPVTRWLLGNGNRKLVTQATPASGVSRKREML